MRKAVLALILLLLLPLSSCSRDPLAPMATSSETENLPAPAVDALPQEAQLATLWFRFGQEPFLVAEARQVPVSPTESYPMALLQALLQGPGAASTELNGLFPQGTKVLSVHQSDRLMFVTLSRHIMNGYADEPQNWREQPAWTMEVPLRRKLAMQSIAATLTENCEVDMVVILVEQSNTVTDSLRLRNSYYTLDGDTTLAEPLRRDEALLLTPARTAEVILECWQQSDWTRLYRYVARTDPATGMQKPEEAAFVQMMTERAHLLRADVKGGSFSADAHTAVFTISGAWMNDGAEQIFDGMVFKLVQDKSLWRVGLSQLTGREALP